MKSNYWEAPDDKFVESTGKDPESWGRILDLWGGDTKTATEIVTYLRQEHSVSKWWSRAVAARYQVDRGLRKAR